MASSTGPVAARRRSADVFDPTAYATRRKEKVEAAAALREQRKKEQEKRESNRGAGTLSRLQAGSFEMSRKSFCE